MTFGRLGEVPPDKAREIAQDLLAKVRLGFDPAGEKLERRDKAGDTFAALLKPYLLRQEKRLSDAWYADTRRYLEQHCKTLHALGVDGIKRATIADLLGGVAAENGPVAADRCRAALSAFFVWVMKEGRCESNPVIATNRYAEDNERDRILTGGEIAEIWHALPNNDDYGDIIRLLLLTGQRRDEVGGMAWSEIEAAAHMWVLPKERMKNGIEHEVPLSEMAWKIVAAIPRYEGRDLCFGSAAGPFQGWSKSKRRLDEAVAEARRKKLGAKAPIMPAWVVHDIRRTVSTGMHELGVMPHIVEAILGHVSGHKHGVAGVYNHALYRGEKAAAMAVWAEYVAALILKA